MVSWIRDFHRRRVPHVGGVYIVVAFGLLQAADLIFPRLGLPDWTVTLALVLLALGLPVALILAWAYELTPDGVTRTEATTPGDPAPASAPPRPRTRAVWLALVGGVGLFVLGGAYLNWKEEPAPALNDDLVAVIPFRVSGDATATYLAEGMMDLLAAKLTGEGGLRAVEPRTVLSAWRDHLGRDDHGGAGAGEADALEVARRVGAGRLLLGSVVASGDRLHFSARIVDAASGHDLVRHEIPGRADSLPWLVDRFAAGLLAGLSGTDPQRVPLLSATPLPALRAYLEGQALFRAGRFEGARAAFGRALTEDSTFALAGIFHTMAAGFTTQWSSEGARLAWRHRQYLAPRDRILLDAQLGPRFPARSTRHERLDALVRATRALPDRPEVWFLLGDEVYHYDTGSPLPERLDRAVRSFRTAAELAPGLAPAIMHLLEIALFQGDTARARRYATAFLAAEPSGELAAYARWFLDRLESSPAGVAADQPFHPFHLLAGQMTTQHGFGLEAADALVEWGLERVSDAHVMVLAGAATYLFDRGRPERALRLWRDRLDASEGRLAVLTTYAELYGEAGLDPATVQEAVDFLDGVARERIDRPGLRWLEAVCVAGQFHAAAGGPDAARVMTAGLTAFVDAAAQDQTTAVDSDENPAPTPGEEPAVSADVRYAYGCAALLEALAADHGDADVARRVVARLDGYHADGTLSDPHLRDATSVALARLYLRLGEPESALAAARRRVVGVPATHFLAGNLRVEGRSGALTGRTDEAARAWSHYLRLRSEPEPGAARLAEEVRAELAALAAES
jgi:tetratricopeptide (TPR) repeat protein/TolB-like protein